MSFEDSVAILEMHSLSVEDSGDYTCEARNAAGSASSSTSLKVKGQTSLHPHCAHLPLYSSRHSVLFSSWRCFKTAQEYNKIEEGIPIE